MEANNPDRNRFEHREENYGKGNSLLPVLLISLFLALVALVMLLWVPSPVSYKNVGNLSELNEEKVRYYTESQNIHLIFKSKGVPDTIRTVADYNYSIKKENLHEEAKRMAEYLSASKRINPDPQIAANSSGIIKNPELPGVKEKSIHSPNPIEKGNTRGHFSDKHDVVIDPDVKPQFPRGQRGLELYFARNKKTPAFARSNRVKGNVDLRFIVNADGTLSDIRILKGLGYGCDEEAIRLLQNMPAWQAAIKDNQAVRCYESLSVKF